VFALEAKKLGFKINTDIKNIQPHHISQWIENNKDNPNLNLINMILLRSMAKAEYDIKNIGHFGLALEDYTHFTSPIRRYPDLMVHRIF
jgi:ribonuclease R